MTDTIQINFDYQSPKYDYWIQWYVTVPTLTILDGNNSMTLKYKMSCHPASFLIIFFCSIYQTNSYAKYIYMIIMIFRNDKHTFVDQRIARNIKKNITTKYDILFLGSQMHTRILNISTSGLSIVNGSDISVMFWAKTTSNKKYCYIL